MMALVLYLQDLVYEKRPTREETRLASIEATKAKAPAVRQGVWKIIGPFDNTDGKGLYVKYPPEHEIDFAAEYVGADGRKVKWADVEYKDGTVLNLDRFGRLDYSLCYLYRVVECDGDVTATMMIGSDDSVTAWQGKEKVHEYLTPRGMPQEKDVAEIDLVKGENRLLFKVANWQGPTEFYYELSLLSPKLLEKLDAKLEEDFPTASEKTYYTIENVAGPKGVELEVGGMCFAKDGALMVCTRRGEVWGLKDAKWTKFATGLHEPLGLWPGEKGELFAVQRPELTRMADTDGDGVADKYECVSAGWGLSGQYHEYAFGPVRDAAGNFYGTLNVAFHDGAVGDARAKYRGWAFRVTPEGKFEPWATGLRSPDGIGISPEGEIFVTDNQGDFVGTSPLHHVTKGAFHGHPAGLVWDPTFKGDPFKTPMDDLKKLRKPAAVLFPFGQYWHSPTQPVWDTTGGKFGPFGGQIIIGDQTQCTLARVVLEKVGGEYQGAVIPLRLGLASGVHRLAWGSDGSLYAGLTDRGWKSIGKAEFGIQRVAWTGRLPMEIVAMSAVKEGFELTFTKPVGEAGTASLQHYHYHYWKTYGSPQVGNTAAAVKEARLSADRRKLTLVLPERVAGKVYELHMKGLKAEDGSELLHPTAFYTLNRIPE